MNFPAHICEMAEAFRLRIVRGGRPCWNRDSPMDHVVKGMLLKQEEKGRLEQSQAVLETAEIGTGEYTSNFLRRVELLLEKPL